MWEALKSVLTSHWAGLLTRLHYRYCKQPAYQVVTYESFDYRIDKYPNLDAIEVVHSQNGATLVLIAQETKSFWFSSFLVSD